MSEDMTMMANRMYIGLLWNITRKRVRRTTNVTRETTAAGEVLR